MRNPITDIPTAGGNWKNKFFFAGVNWGQVASTGGGNTHVTSHFSTPGCLLA